MLKKNQMDAKASLSLFEAAYTNKLVCIGHIA